jgi:hypothetical protein
MADTHNTDDHSDKRPHGETGDTVQQAAEVSKPTTTVYPGLDKTDEALGSPDAKAGIAPQEKSGGQA